MEMTRIKKSLSLALCIVLITAIALFTSGCNDNTSQATSETATVAETAVQAESNVLGEGDTQFTFTVTDVGGNETEFEINTDKTTVGEALIELGLIDGDDGEFGLYVKTVNGITVDYDTDGKYWAFYVGDEYAVSGVDSTEIVEGETYSFKVE